jgi:hypothetical protein
VTSADPETVIVRLYAYRADLAYQRPTPKCVVIMQFEALRKLNPRVRSLHKGVSVPDDTCLTGRWT